MLRKQRKISLIQAVLARLHASRFHIHILSGMPLLSACFKAAMGARRHSKFPHCRMALGRCRRPLIGAARYRVGAGQKAPPPQMMIAHAACIYAFTSDISPMPRIFFDIGFLSLPATHCHRGFIIISRYLRQPPPQQAHHTACSARSS